MSGAHRHAALLQLTYARAVHQAAKKQVRRAQISGAETAAAPGIACTFVTKAGVGLSGMTGRGFVLRKV